MRALARRVCVSVRVPISESSRRRRARLLRHGRPACATAAVLAALSILPNQASGQNVPEIFDPAKSYRIWTRYGGTTEVELDEYLAAGVAGVSFSLASCDATRSDYYREAELLDGKLVLKANELGHVHGAHTQTDTVCTVTGSNSGGTQSREFSFYIPADRNPSALPAGRLRVDRVQADKADIAIAGTPLSPYLRLGWRKPGGRFAFRIVSGAGNGVVLTVSGLHGNTDYELLAQYITRQRFDLSRGGLENRPLTLMSEQTPDRRWISNLAGGGAGKSRNWNFTTGQPDLAVSDTAVVEAPGAMAKFTVTLSASGGQRVTAEWKTDDGTATAGEDYMARSGTVSFAPGETTKTIAVPVIDDSLTEPEERFSVLLNHPENAGVIDPEGIGTIADGLRVPPPAAERWLAHFGQLAVAHAFEALGARARCPPERRPGGGSTWSEQRWRCGPLREKRSFVEIGGYRAGDWAAPAGTASEEARREAPDAARHRTAKPGPMAGTRTLTAQDILAASAFDIGAGLGEEEPETGFWGRSRLSRFEDRGRALASEGKVVSFTVGAERTEDRRVVGIAFSHSRGEGTIRYGSSDYEADSYLTGIFPYLHYGLNERWSVWGSAGSAAGILRFSTKGGHAAASRLRIHAGVLGARGEIVSPTDSGDYSLTVECDTRLARAASAGAPGLAAAAAGISQLRLALEGAREHVSEDGELYAPFVEAGLRWDDNSVRSGSRVAAGVGLRYANPQSDLTAEFEARGSIARSGHDYSERGMAGSLRYDPNPYSQHGPSLEIRHSTGAADIEATGLPRSLDGIADGVADGRRRIPDAVGVEFGYGFPIAFSSGIRKPWVSFSLSGRRRDLRFGYRLGFRRSAVFELEAAAIDIAGGGQRTEYEAVLRLSLRM